MQAHLKKIHDEIKSGQAQFFDVREQHEWDAGHLKDARLVPLSDLSQGKEPAGSDKTKKTYLHCRSGNRVYQAAPLLENMGFKLVIPMDEGFEDLAYEGFEEAK